MFFLNWDKESLSKYYGVGGMHKIISDDKINLFVKTFDILHQGRSQELEMGGGAKLLGEGGRLSPPPPGARAKPW